MRSQSRFYGLDGLRGVAAFSVLLFHCEDFFRPGPLLQHGGLAVDVFFALSGFVIALNYEQRLAAGMSLLRFLHTRAKRLIPIYWLGSLVCIVAAVVIFLGPLKSVVSANTFVGITIMMMLLIPRLSSDHTQIFPLNSPAWSLFAEWVANFIYATGLFRISTRLLFVLVATTWSVYLFSPLWGNLLILKLDVVRALAGFCSGVVLFRIKDHRWFQGIPAIMPEILYCVWLVLAAVPVCGLTTIYDAVVTIVCAPLLIALLIRSEARAPQWCAWAGKLSYPLYASHFSIIIMAQTIPAFGLTHGPNPLYGLIVVAAALLLAWGIARLNDRIQGWIQHPAVVPAE